MARAPHTAPAGAASAPTPATPNAAKAAFAAFQPQIDKVHKEAERVAGDRRKLIASITDPSLRASVSS